MFFSASATGFIYHNSYLIMFKGFGKNMMKKGIPLVVVILMVLTPSYGLALPDSLISEPELVEHHWPMKCYNAQRTGQSPFSTEDNGGGIKWIFIKSGGFESSPVIAQDGTIYFGQFINLYALNPDGTEKWNYSTTDLIDCTPAIAPDGTIYIGSTDDHLYAVNPDGTLKWTFDAGGNIRSSPIVGEDGTIYFGTTYGYRFYAILPNGTEKWHYDTTYRIFQSPAISHDNTTVYISCHDTYLYALDTKFGTLKWKYKMGDWPGSPSVGADKTIYIPSWDNNLYALYQNGTLKWKCQVVDGSGQTPTIANDGTIYIGSWDMYAINPDGTVKWTYALEDGYFVSSPAAIASEETIYFGAHDVDNTYAYLYALNPDGILRWRKTLGNSFMFVAPAIAQDGTVYAGCNHDQDGHGYGYLYAFGELDPDAPEPPTIDGPTRGKVGETHDYTFTTTSPLGRDVYYYVEWGDGQKTDWTGPYNSGEPVILSHTWDERGDYTIKARAKDTENLWSDWGELDIRMPISQTFDEFPLLRLLSELLSWFPNLFLFLQYLGF